MVKVIAVDHLVIRVSDYDASRADVDAVQAFLKAQGSPIVDPAGLL
jgi:hypothetical protein